MNDDPKSHEQFYEAAIQTVEAYRSLMLGDPLTFAISITGVWMLCVSGSLSYWREK